MTGDGFNGIDGMERKWRNELLLRMALLYVCFQILVISIKYFVITSLRRMEFAEENATQWHELSVRPEA